MLYIKEIDFDDFEISFAGAKASLPSTPKESPPSPQLSRIPRFNRRLSSTPGLEQESPGRANSQASLNTSAGIVQSPGPDSISPNNGYVLDYFIDHSIIFYVFYQTLS